MQTTTRNTTYETNTSDDVFSSYNGLFITKEKSLSTRCIDCPTVQKTKTRSQLENKEHHHDDKDDTCTKEEEDELLPCRLSSSEAKFTFWKDIMIAIWATTP
ncbi:hypothetical protein O0I10_008251 [Lichtheimia ornata]|uniref:Uncharacterized protein n=1 Tax=Lichtheimia ornata TaxID=688661 RepID=A0AAD7XT62_9FUNG|nr:uncharacterized protein O0I10_008251 [Lichtheimia ornata]KAJ8656029.1 hypothetical protein O0I10_008251 [Lichtheimia ornata]